MAPASRNPGALCLAILGTRGIPAQYGGFETFAEELSTRLVDAGVRVTVYCEGSRDDDPGSYRGVDLVRLRAPRLGPFSTIWFDMRCLWHARRSFDVVYMLGYGAAFFCFIPRIWGSRVWINMDGIEWRRAKWGVAARLWLRVMEKVATWTAGELIADAEAIKQFLRSSHRTMPVCHVVPYGAILQDGAPDVSALRQLGLEARRYLLIVCRLEPENHVLEAIRGFEKSSLDLELAVVGNLEADSSYVKTLQERAGRGVRFLGGIYDQLQLRALRYHCLAYVHGHSVGGTNPSLLEALGCGNLIIAHDNPFNREVAGDCASYFRDEDDFARLARAVSQMGEEERLRLSARAKDRIADRYTWEQVTQAYLDLLRCPAPKVE